MCQLDANVFIITVGCCLVADCVNAMQCREYEEQEEEELQLVANIKKELGEDVEYVEDMDTGQDVAEYTCLLRKIWCALHK